MCSCEVDLYRNDRDTDENYNFRELLAPCPMQSPEREKLVGRYGIVRYKIKNR